MADGVDGDDEDGGAEGEDGEEPEEEADDAVLRVVHPGTGAGSTLGEVKEAGRGNEQVDAVVELGAEPGGGCGDPHEGHPDGRGEEQEDVDDQAPHTTSPHIRGRRGERGGKGGNLREGKEASRRGLMQVAGGTRWAWLMMTQRRV